MIFLYSYTIFCAFFLFALDHLDDFCFVHKFRIRKILSHYFTFQLFAFFIQFLSFQCLAYLNIANLNAALSFISRMTGIISFGYVAYLIDYFWLENRLKLKKRIIYYTVIITIAEFIFFLTNEFTAKFNIYFHLAERFCQLITFSDNNFLHDFYVQKDTKLLLHFIHLYAYSCYFGNHYR